MKDRDENIIKAGDRFIYQVGEPHECSGEIFDCGGVDVIKWDDDDAIVSVKDFYHQPTDQLIIQKI